MTVREMLTLVRSELKQIGKLRYRNGTTTGLGAADGSYIISSSFGGVDDAWNGAECRITDVNHPAYDQRREVGAWSSILGQMVMVEPFTHQIGSGVTFEVGEKGFISDHQILDFLTAAQNDIILRLPIDAFNENLVAVNVSGVSGIAALPSIPFVGLPNSVYMKLPQGGNVDIIILPRNQEDKFNRHAYLGTLDEPIGIYKDGVLFYKPAIDATIYFVVLPIPLAVTFSGGSSVLPDYLHIMLVKYAVAQGFKSVQKYDAYQVAISEYEKLVAQFGSS